MKRAVIGVVMIVVPAGYIFYLCLVSSWGFWRTFGIFAFVIGWCAVASNLIYANVDKVKQKG